MAMATVEQEDAVVNGSARSSRRNPASNWSEFEGGTRSVLLSCGCCAHRVVKIIILIKQQQQQQQLLQQLHKPASNNNNKPSVLY